MRKCDYLKGITAGLALTKKLPKRYLEYRISYRAEIDNAIRHAQEKYQDTLPETANGPFGSLENESQPYCRASYYAQGMRDALEYGSAQTFAVFRYDGMGHYNVGKLAERVVYADPSKASMRAWELDPNGHKYTIMALHCANGVSEELKGLEVKG